MAVDPNIKKKADDIRNKIYGKEVRESLASGLEAMSSDVVENEGRQSVVESRQDSVESQWQSVSDEMTDKDVISAPEIIAARNGEANLKTRIDKDKQEVTTQLAHIVSDNAVSPENFEGSDYEKVQQAVDHATENRLDLRFSRMYDITGHTVFINKTNDRRILRFNGWGGGVIKNDDGYMFSAPEDVKYIGDVHSVGMKYEGDLTALEMTVWNAGAITSGIIRLGLINDTYKNVSHVISEPDDYIQSVRIFNCTITGGRGWAIEYKNAFDVAIENNTIEHRQHGIRNTVLSSDPGTTNLRLINNVIEGLSGKGLEIGSTFGGTIAGNYMEVNAGGYMSITPTGTAVTQGLVIEGNSFLMNGTQIAEGVSAIKIKNMGINGIVSRGNMSRGTLYEILTPDTSTGGLVHSTGDGNVGGGQLISGQTQRFVDASRPQEIGKAYKEITGDEIINPNQTVSVVIDFSDNATWIKRGSILSVKAVTSSGSKEIRVKNYTIDASTNEVTVYVENTGSTGNFYPVLYVTVMELL